MKQTLNEATSRRLFLQQLSLLGAAGMLPISWLSCSKNTSNLNYSGNGLGAYKVWEEMLMAIKTSPDYLEGRMQTLIKSKDPKAILAFVRDEIYLIPSESNSLKGLGKMMITGISGVLRSGFATPREKAELLNSMLNQAGFNAEVVYERTNFQPEDVKTFFFKPRNRTFEPLINNSILDRWNEELQMIPSQEKPFEIDPNEKESIALAAQLYTLLPQDQLRRLHTFDYKWDNNRTPCVILKNENQDTFCHLFDPTVAFGALKEGENGKTSQADPAEYIDKKLQIIISVTSGDQPEQQIIHGEWTLKDLVGNQLLLHFGTGLGLTQQLQKSIGSLNTFTPSLSLQSFSMDIEEMSKKSIIGKTITLQGDIIDTTSEVVKVNNLPVVISTENNLKKQVEQLTVQAIPGKYPFVKLEMTPKDINGKQVAHLPATDFHFKLNGRSISALMLNNIKTPKIIIMYDTSGSMPGGYSGKPMDDFVNQLELKVLEEYPAANIQKWKTSSQLYTWLHKASSTNADLILFATDGDNNDKLKDEWLYTYKNGAPAIILNVRNSENPRILSTFQTLADATNGMVLQAQNQEETRQRIVNFLKDFEIAPYVFTFNALDKLEENELTVSIDSERVEAKTKFKFTLFPVENTALGSELSGVYLEISYDKFKTKKTLAGYDPSLHKSRTPNQTDFLDVKSLLLGGAMIGIESQGPTFANQMADLLQYKLSSRPLGEALINNEIEEAKSHYENGIYIYDDRIASLLQPLKNQVTNNSFTFAAGPRIGIIKNKIGLGTQQSSVNFDYIQTSNFVTLASDPIEAFKINMQKTAQMALMEQALFEEATFSLLKNKPLIELLAAKQIKRFDQDFEQESKDFYRERIFKNSGEFKIFDQTIQAKAFWSINNKTGELYGILENGTAGGVERIRRQLDEIMKVMDTYLLLLGAMSVAGGIPLAIVGGYGKTLVKLYAIASEAIVIMDTSGMDEQVRIALAELACETYKTIALGLYGNLGTAISGIEYLIGMITGKSICSLK